MKIFVTHDEVLELAIEYLDMIRPNPDKSQDIALKLDMVYDEYLDMFEDVERYSTRHITRNLKSAYHALQDNRLNSEKLRRDISDILTID